MITMIHLNSLILTTGMKNGPLSLLIPGPKGLYIHLVRLSFLLTIEVHKRPPEAEFLSSWVAHSVGGSLKGSACWLLFCWVPQVSPYNNKQQQQYHFTKIKLPPPFPTVDPGRFFGNLIKNIFGEKY